MTITAFDELCARSPVLRSVLAVVEAQQPGADLWVVGGAVRDLAMGIPPTDVDFVVEADPAAIATAAAAQLEWVVELHERFGTAALARPEAPRAAGWLASRPTQVTSIDFAQARTESYTEPGALPTVTAATIEDDLARRDFSVNAMALCVAGVRRGEVLDPFGGRDDLAGGVLRLLHDRSAWDDPTRILRGVRYRAQLGMRFAVATAEQIEAAVADDVLDSVSSDRIRHELERWFGAGVADALEAADRAGIAGILIPGVALDIDRIAAALSAVSIGCRPGRPLGEVADIELGVEDWWTLICAAAGEDAAAAAVAAYDLPARIVSTAATIRDIVARASDWMAARDAESRVGRTALAELAGQLPSRDLHTIALAGEVAAGTHASVALDRLAETLADLQIHVDGADILELGIPEGPRVRELLDAIWFAALSGYATTEAAQRALLARAAEAHEGPSGR